jgi:hypothetical protein
VRSQKRTRADYNTTTQTENDTYFYYLIWWAFVDKVFDAKLGVAEMEKKCEAGLGSFNVLNGEMV